MDIPKEIPYRLREALRVAVLTRCANDDPEGHSQQLQYAEAWIRSVYDWPLSVQRVKLPNDDSQSWLCELTIQRLVESGNVDLVLVEDLTRLSRSRAVLMDVLTHCAAAGVTVTSARDGLCFHPKAQSA